MTMKLLRIIVIFLFFCSLLCVSAKAEDASSELIKSGGGDELFSSLPDETRELLENTGVDEISFENIFSVSPKSLLGLVKKLVTGGIEAPTKSLIKLIAVIILLSVAECFMPEDGQMKLISDTVGALFCIVSVISPLTTAISSAAASIEVSGDFMLALIPVLAAVITAAGNPTLALSFRSIAFGAAQFISAVSKNCITPIVGAVLSLDITGALMPSFRLDSLTELIKKTLTAVLSFAATLFVAFLGIKGALANAADTVASRGIKLAISSAVPVVGGALSEAYSGILGSLVLARSTVGIFGIAAIALVNLPSCIQLLFWIFALRVGSAAGELFGQDGTAQLLKAIASAITLLNVVLLFNAVLFIISTALLLLIKAG